jgi:DNA-binding NtrC family response regulator
VVERAVMMVMTDTITAQDIRALLPSGDYKSIEVDGNTFVSLPYMEAKELAIEQFTKTYLQAKLAANGGVIAKAAESSGIPRQHFSLLMKRFLGSMSTEED